jgi:glucose-6-phosphate 1-dehydrogenase
MEPPISFEAEALRNEKVKLLQSLRPIAAHDVSRHTIRGQYEDYRRTKDVDPNSQTATFVAARLFVDNWRWDGVPFYVRSGKALAEKSTEISIMFRRPPQLMFPANPDHRLAPNDLSICIQPDEGIHFSFEAKVPDTAAKMRTVDMTFHYADSFGPQAIPDAYERLLLDVIRGDPTLFTRADSIELAWALVDPIIAGWHGEDAPPLHTYARDSWGPAAAHDFIAHDGYTWSLACMEH